MQPLSKSSRFAGLVLAVLVGAGVLAGPAVAEAAGPLRVLPLGDSLTWGKGSSDAGGYRPALRDELTAAGADVDFVGSQRNGPGPDPEHEGHPGWEIGEITAQIGGWLAQATPDVVLLDIGTNDVLHDVDLTFAPLRLSDLLDQILLGAPSARIVVAKLLVIRGEPRAAKVRAFNAAMAEVVERHGPQVSLADMSRLASTNTVDGVHPTDAGYRQMAYQWYQSLRPVLPGGATWPLLPDPFPVPVLGLFHSAGLVVAPGGKMILTARLSGQLTSVDLAGIAVRLSFRPAGTAKEVTLAVVRTGTRGRARFSTRASVTGYYTATVLSGRARGARVTLRIATARPSPAGS